MITGFVDAAYRSFNRQLSLGSSLIILNAIPQFQISRQQVIKRHSCQMNVIATMWWFRMIQNTVSYKIFQAAVA